MGNDFTTSEATSAAATGIAMNDLRARIQEMYPRHIPIRGFLEAVRNVVQHIHRHGKWSFNFKQAVFSTVDDESTGTLAVTNGNASIVGTGTTFISGHVGRKIRISGVEYEFGTFTDTTHGDLTQTYVGKTDSGVSFVIYQDEYNLASDVKTLYRMWDSTNENELTVVPQLELRSKTLGVNSGGDIREYAEIGFSSTNLRRILLRPYPAEIVHVEYWYEVEITHVTTITSQVDLPSTMDRTVIQGVYARIMQINNQTYPVVERRLANQHFRDLLDEQWKVDKPLRDIEIRMARRDDFDFPLRLIRDRRPRNIFT